MSLYKDYVAFIDGDCPVPYHMEQARYCQKPNIISESFDYDFKTYIKSYNNYYVSIATNDFVRPIYAKDYKLMKSLADERKQLNIKKLGQLCFDF